MINRHLSRTIVLQTLFEWDRTSASISDADTILERNRNEFAGDSTSIPFMKKLLSGVFENRDDIDLIITRAAPDWPLDKIAPIDRNILRLGLYELLFSDRKQTPAKVAINEAIELAKTFGGESSGRFINGVLGTVYKEIGEPGKDEFPGRRKKTEPLPIESLVGALVYAKYNGQYYVALVHDVFGHWTLSKGHVVGTEPETESVVRVVREELGLSGVSKDMLGKNEYIASHPEKGKALKRVSFFLVSAPFEHINLKKSGGLDDARWFKTQDILDLNFYDDMLPIVTAGVQTLIERASVSK